MRRRRNQGGFTLIELMITLAVVAFGMSAMLLMQMQALKGGKQGKHRTGAAMIAQDQLERIQNMPFSDAGLDVMSPAVWTTPPWLANTADATLSAGEVPVTVAQAGVGPQREIVYTVNYLVTEDDAASPNPDMRRVDVEVLWNEDGISNNKPTRTGQPTVAVSTMLVNNDR